LHGTKWFSTIDTIRDDSVRGCWLYLPSVDLHQTHILCCVRCVASIVVMLSLNILPLEMDQNTNKKYLSNLLKLNLMNPCVSSTLVKLDRCTSRVKNALTLFFCQFFLPLFSPSGFLFLCLAVKHFVGLLIVD